MIEKRKLNPLPLIPSHADDSAKNNHHRGRGKIWLLCPHSYKYFSPPEKYKNPMTT
jgi:hypothetical protein